MSKVKVEVLGFHSEVMRSLLRAILVACRVVERRVGGEEGAGRMHLEFNKRNQ